MLRGCTLSIGVIFRKIRTGQPNRWESVILSYLMAYPVPCIRQAPRYPLHLSMRIRYPTQQGTRTSTKASPREMKIY